MSEKIIDINAGWKMHSMYEELVRFPPEGYRFEVSGSALQDIVRSVCRSRLTYRLFNAIGQIVPTNLVRAHLDKLGNRSSQRVIYSCVHPYSGQRPWIMDLGSILDLTGGSMKMIQTRKYIERVESLLSSPFCRAILCFYHATKRELLANLNCRGFEDKISVIYPAIHKKSFTKSFRDDRTRILFVSSRNILGEFEMKGGKEVLEVFSWIRQQYDDVELVVRSDVPKSFMKKYENLPGLQIFHKVISRADLDREFKAADIFLLPAHHTPAMAFIEAMSYELPVVTTDVFANSEIVEDGKTGFVVQKSSNVDYPVEDFVRKKHNTRWVETISRVDPELVENLIHKVSVLMERPELRRRMGNAARSQIEEGKFSIQRRNRDLKMILDQIVT